MVDSPDKGDNEYRQAHDRALLVFAKDFDDWAARVVSTRQSQARMVSTGQSQRRGTLGDLIKGASDDERRQLGKGIDLVWDLAKLCQRFVSRDLLAWSLSLQRYDVSIHDIVHGRLPKRAVDVEYETRTRKWHAGLGIIGLTRWESYYEETSDVEGEREHETDAWRFVVEEGTEDVIAAIGAGLAHGDGLEADHRSARALERRERLGKYLVGVFKRTGEKVTQNDFSLAAGYQDRKQLQAYLRGEDSLTAVNAFENAFNIDPQEFPTAADRRREIVGQKKLSRL